MPSLRQRWKVSWDGGEPVEVTTTVQDLIAAVDRIPAESAGNNVALNATLIYAALARSPHEVPPYAEWLDVLDNYEDITPGPNGSGPTRRDPSPPEPSSSPASPEATGDPGSDPTPENSTT